MSLREATRYYLLTMLFPVFFTPPLTTSISICSLVQGRIVHEFLSSDAVKHQCAERDAVHGDVGVTLFHLGLRVQGLRVHAAPAISPWRRPSTRASPRSRYSGTRSTTLLNFPHRHVGSFLQTHERRRRHLRRDQTCPTSAISPISIMDGDEDVPAPPRCQAAAVNEGRFIPLDHGCMRQHVAGVRRAPRTTTSTRLGPRLGRRPRPLQRGVHDAAA